ncbi:MAG: hypothetical protein KC425_03475 [Anaerolineales bacterium]|nr:hypothetical protein [Anaerolineales bacterium]
MLVGSLTACQQQNSAPPIVVTEVVVFEGEEVTVTRIVRQTIAVTPTAVPINNVDAPVVLDLGYVGGFPNVDPQTTDDPNGIDLAENLFASLTRYNQVNHQIEPELATSWTVENGRIWTFQLREDIFWVRANQAENGRWVAEPLRPVLAQDVVAAIQRACLRETQTPDAIVLFIIEGCEAVYNTADATNADLSSIAVRALTDHMLEVTLVRPASHFLTLTTMTLFDPVPAAELAALQEETPPGDWQSADVLLTSGPFVPDLNTWGETRVILHRNTAWPLPFTGNVEVINVNFLGEAENAFKLWEVKGLDISPLPAGQRETILEEAPSRVQLISEQTLFYLGFNFDSGVFREPQIRRAFSAAIDRQVLVDEVYDGRATAMRHLTPPGVVGAPPVDEVGVGYSPDYARQQLEASGFRSCRLLPPMTFMISSSDLSLLQAELIRDMWVSELNCDETQIEFEQVPFGTLLANTRADAGAARPDMWELGWASYYPDANNWVGDLLHCTESENRQNRPCSDIDQLIRQADAVTNPAERIPLYRQIENALFGADGMMPVIPLYVRGSYLLVQNWLEFTPALFGGEQYDTYVVDAVTKELERELERGR